LCRRISDFFYTRYPLDLYTRNFFGTRDPAEKNFSLQRSEIPKWLLGEPYERLSRMAVLVNGDPNRYEPEFLFYFTKTLIWVRLKHLAKPTFMPMKRKRKIHFATTFLSNFLIDCFLGSSIGLFMWMDNGQIVYVYESLFYVFFNCSLFFVDFIQFFFTFLTIQWLIFGFF
jgi:hypothetical protein